MESVFLSCFYTSLILWRGWQTGQYFSCKIAFEVFDIPVIRLLGVLQLAHFENQNTNLRRNTGYGLSAVGPQANIVLIDRWQLESRILVKCPLGTGHGGSRKW